MELESIFIKWKEWITIIESEVRTLSDFRLMFNEINNMKSNNPNIQKDTPYWGLYYLTYVDSALIRIRKQIEINKKNKNISLARLLKQIVDFPSVLSRERFIGIFMSNTKPVNDFDRVHWENWANKYFDKWGKEHINKELVQNDLTNLISKSMSCITYTDMRIVHQDYNEPTIPTFGELNDCIDLLEKLTKEYSYFFSGIDIFFPSNLMSDWDDVFRVPWIKK